MKKIHLFSIVEVKLLLSIILFSVCSSYAEAVTIQDKEGREVDAEVLSLTKGKLKLKRKDGKIFSIKMSSLSETSQSSVLAELKSRANKISEKTLKVSYNEKRIAKSQNNSESRSIDINEIIIEITLENRGKYALEGLVLEYTIYYTEERLGRGDKDFSQERSFQGKLDIPKLDPKSKVKLKTKSVELWNSSMNGNFMPSSGSKDSAQDEIVAKWIRIKKGNTILFEHSYPADAKTEKSWAVLPSK
ncbi:hypothetical protein P4C99_05600 [Pontiellaceae bacterium B1224]|nr:hypothetical protein [Pontiellaceae bacterium B1224]